MGSNINAMTALGAFMKGRADKAKSDRELQQQEIQMQATKAKAAIDLQKAKREQAEYEEQARIREQFSPVIQSILGRTIPQPSVAGPQEGGGITVRDSRQPDVPQQAPVQQPAFDVGNLSPTEMMALMTYGGPLFKDLPQVANVQTARQRLNQQAQRNWFLQYDANRGYNLQALKWSAERSRVVPETVAVPGGGEVVVLRNYFTGELVDRGGGGQSAPPSGGMATGGPPTGGAPSAGGATAGPTVAGQPAVQARQGMPVPQFGGKVYKTLPRGMKQPTAEELKSLRGPRGEKPDPGMTWGELDAAGFRMTTAGEQSAMIDMNSSLAVLDQLSEMSGELHTAEDGIERMKQMPEVWAQVKLQIGDKRKVTVANAYQALKEGTLAKFVRSFGERGTLTDGDIARARLFLPTYYPTPDTKHVARAKLEMLRDLMAEINDRTMGKPVENVKQWEKDVTEGRRGVYLPKEEESMLNRQIEERARLLAEAEQSGGNPEPPPADIVRQLGEGGVITDEETGVTWQIQRGVPVMVAGVRG